MNDVQQPPVTPESPEPQQRSKWIYVAGGCGVLIFACIGLIVVGVIIGALTDDDQDATPTIASGSNITATQSPEDSTSTAESTSASTPTTHGSTDTTTPIPEATPTQTATTEPTSTPEPTPTLEPTPIPVGAGRSNPVPIGEVGITPNGDWEIQVLEVVRGEEAWNRILATNQFNDPPPPGMEYVMTSVRAKYLGTSSEAQEIDRFDFDSTGDARVRWRNASVVTPDPELDAELFSGGEAIGWVVMLAREGEGNLIAIYEPTFSLDEGDEIFLGLQEGASVPPILERQAEINDVGTDRQSPAAFGEHAVMEVWNIWISEAIRGEEAWNRIFEANQFNEEPPAGQEYVLVYVHARNVKGGHGSDDISSFDFQSTGSNNIVYERVSVVEPEPSLDFDVYAGGEVDGWVTVLASVGETDMSLVFNESLFGGETRYLSMTP